MKGKLKCQMEVRSYELDSYGHVNHAVFLNYFEHARVEYLGQKGMSFKTLWDEGYIFVIVRAQVDYFKPLCSADKIDITGEIRKIGNTSITITQEIHRQPEAELVCRGKFVAVFLDRTSGAPAAVPASFKKAFS